jgi:AdoMet-dependent rRNA methyltransferase SPB1
MQRHLQCSFALEGPDAEAAPEAVEGEDDVVGALGYAALAARIRDSPATTAEIRATCADLQVLGRSEFKALLKW